jgi:hypothetical protein
MAAYDIVLLKDGSPKPLKLPAKPPKALGPLVDAYKAWSDRRLAESKKGEAFIENEKALKAYLIDNIPKGDGGVVGDKFKAIIKVEDTFQVEDWEALWKYIVKNQAWELLMRSINQAAVREHTDALNAKLDVANAKIEDPRKRKPRKMLPGIKTFSISKLSVTKK